jgi:hypothetical protein
VRRLQSFSSLYVRLPISNITVLLSGAIPECCSVGKGEEIGKTHMSGEVARSVGVVLNREYKLGGKIYYKLHTMLSYFVCYPLHILYLNLSCEYGCQLFGVHLYSSCVYRGVLRFTCCFMCVLLSYLSYYVGIAVLVVICVYCCTCCTMCVLLVLL